MKYPVNILLLLILFFPRSAYSQWNWKNVDAEFGPLPASMHIYRTSDSTEGKPNIAYYVTVDLKDRSHYVTTQVGNGKRYTPSQYYEQEGKPLLVMNCTFFEFVHNRNQNIVIKDGKMVAYQVHSIPGRGKDTFTYRHAFGGAIGTGRNRKADVAWVYTDSAGDRVYASQQPVNNFRDSVPYPAKKEMLVKGGFRKWKMQTATGGGPVLVQHGEIAISNNEEIRFGGKAINDKHPRSAMGYTGDNQLIFLVIGSAEGATLTQTAQMLKQIGCVEGLNLDGGGSSCLLINGKQTITPSDKEGQRPVPAVMIVK